MIYSSFVLIQVMDTAMSSEISISNTTGTDSGTYTCRLTLSVANTDTFTFSDFSIVALSGE